MNVNKFNILFVLATFFLLLILTSEIAPSIYILLFISTICILSLYFSYQTGHYEVFLAVLLILAKAPILMHYYPPLSPLDAENFYNFAFNGELKSLSEVSQNFLNLNMIEITAYLYKTISWYISSEDIHALVYVNYFLVLMSGFFIWKVYKKSACLNATDNKGLYLYVFIVVMSPLLNKYSTYLLKEALSLSLVCFIVYYIQKLLTDKRYINLLYIVPALIIATVVRPYNFIYILSFLVFFGFFSNKKIIILLIGYFLSVFIYFLLFQSGSALSLLKDIILSMVAIVAAPNFMRIDSWFQIPLMLLESSFLFLFSVIYFYFSNNDYRFKFFASILLISITLGGVSYNRSTKVEQLHSIKEGSLLSDDIARKKFSFQIILLLIPIIVVRREINK